MNAQNDSRKNPTRKPRRIRACKHCKDGEDRNGNICTYCAGDGQHR